MSTRDPDPAGPAVDPTAQGIRARQQGRSRDACPYPLDSQERKEWLEGYDGREASLPFTGPTVPE